MRVGSAAFVLLCLVVTSAVDAQNKRDMAVRIDKQLLSSDDSWFYDDLDAAIDAAAKTRRPLMIVFR